MILDQFLLHFSTGVMQMILGKEWFDFMQKGNPK